MSSAHQLAPGFCNRAWAERFANADSRHLARRVSQAMVLLPLFSLVLLPEYVQGLGDPQSKSILYRATVGPLRAVDVLLLAVIAVHGVVWASSRRMRVQFPRTLAIPGLGFLAAIAVGMLYGGLHGGTNLFFDWRALALGIGLYGVFAMWTQTPERARTAVYWFAGYMAVQIATIYASFFGGGGDVIVGVRIPVFDGPTLSAVVFTAGLALWMSDHARGAWRQTTWITLSAASYVLVLLSFRRTFWAELGIATGLALLLQRRRRWRKLLLAAAMFAAVATMLGPAFLERLESLDFTAGESEFSQGNPDHVGEVLDAWEQVKRAPMLGIGLGRSYPTLRIQDWKEESVMVHNAPLHVWLKYGLMGLAFYVWFHIALFRWLGRQRRKLSDEATIQLEWLGAALAYLAAQFAVGLGFSPWPYTSLQSSILVAFILAIALRGTSQCQLQTSQSSLHR
jgi:O-antigen ligase